jgi:hypothetical protein
MRRQERLQRGSRGALGDLTPRRIELERKKPITLGAFGDRLPPDEVEVRAVARHRLGIDDGRAERNLHRRCCLTPVGRQVDLSTSENPSVAFAELLDLLARLTASELRTAVADLPTVVLSPYWQNYLAATVEEAAVQKKVAPPEWTSKIRPLEEPVFGSTLRSLREHLLFNAPPAFRRRNIFIDASVGARV